MIAIRDSVAFNPHKAIIDPQGRFPILVCDIESQSTTYTVANIYAPNKGQICFFHKIMKQIQDVKRGRVILCGDFDITPDPTLDSTAIPKRSPPSFKEALR